MKTPLHIKRLEVELGFLINDLDKLNQLGPAGVSGYYKKLSYIEAAIANLREEICEERGRICQKTY